MLRTGVGRGRVSHAQLFVGEEGYGTLALAWAYAQYLNCQQPNDSDACGQCPSCRKYEKLAHADLHLTFPVFRSKTRDDQPATSKEFLHPFREAVIANPYLDYEDWLNCIRPEGKQLNISAEECRSLLQRLSLRHYEGRYKVVIIWQAGFLGSEGNILLKMLEEPPERTVWLLTARNRDELLPTVASRCQPVRLPPIAEPDLAAALMSRLKLPETEAGPIARMSMGNWNEALRLLQQQVASLAPLFNEWLRLSAATDRRAAWLWVEQIAALGREEQKAFFRYALTFLRQWLHEQHQLTDQARLPQDATQAAERLTVLSPTRFGRLIHLLEQGHYHIERNAHAKLVFMNLLLQSRPLLAV